MPPHVLYDVNLQQLPADFLEGPWQVVSRVLPRSGSAESPLSQATAVELAGTAVRVAAPDGAEPALGQWQMLLDPGINRPYLELHLPAGPARALITRLRRSRDGEEGLLDLYFQSGLELQLHRIS
ncbi:hypothetical protein [Hymenobacter weizhouensis]|uniref:hypothetical protein n=1 Tax=Hymenobacter sp. YIM 151500-1 TaxID=2987689 RepID=UPI0022267DCC|nr:hypothetical protein [Hymenobacter sp. YIM 151500-1]UYZ62493.1 hypothetical protein OIS53_16015 [Hymenobacter sp. YIM 151500-1]